MRTVSETLNLFNQFRSTYDGQRVDYWGYAGECLSLGKRWVDTLRNGHIGGTMQAPAASNGFGTGYYNDPPKMIRDLFDKQPYNPNAQYPAGSLFTYSSSGHIGMLVDNQPGQGTALVYQQNADPDGSATGHRQRGKARIDGILVIRTIPDPPPAPAAPLWTVQDIPDKEVKVNAGRQKWNLGHGDFNSVAANPITTSDGTTIFTARAILHHREIPQYNYYLEDPSTPHGWNVLDCIDYTPPPPTPITSYIPPTINLAEKYDLVTTVPYYPTDSDAWFDRDARGTLANGSYFVHDRKQGMILLSKDNMKHDNRWINPKYNTLEVKEPIIIPPKPEPVVELEEPAPVPEPPKVEPPAPVEPVEPEPPVYIDESWKTCYPLFDDRLPTALKSSNSIPVKIKALDGKKPDFIELPPHKELQIVSWFEKGGVKYYRDDELDEYKRFYALPAAMFPDPYDLPKIDTNRDGDITISDFVDYAGKYGTQVFKSGVAVIAKAAQQIDTRKFIDGFKSGSNKKKG